MRPSIHLNIPNSCTTCSLRHRSSDVFYPLKCQYEKEKIKEHLNYISMCLFWQSLTTLKISSWIHINWHAYHDDRRCLSDRKVNWTTTLGSKTAPIIFNNTSPLKTGHFECISQLILVIFISGRKNNKLKNSFADSSYTAAKGTLV